MRTLAIASVVMALLLLLVGCGEGLPERHLAATRQAEESAVKVEATRQHLNHEATAQAVAISATATAAAVASEGEELRLERQRQLQPVRTWGWVIFGVSVMTAVGVVGWRFTGVLEDRARLVRRRPDEGESILLVRTTDGNLAYDLPLRHPTSSSRRLADPVEQAKATMRQQTANALQARQAAKIVAARHQQPQVKMLPTSRSQHALRRPGAQESGLTDVAQLSELDGAIEAGMLPKQLANAIDTEWREVKSND